MPCQDSDSKDLPYLKKIFEFIESSSDKFDLSRIYAHGFSQNSVWSSVIGFCFHDKIRGIFLGASGMSIKGQGLQTTSCGGYVNSTAAHCSNILGTPRQKWFFLEIRVFWP